MLIHNNESMEMTHEYKDEVATRLVETILAAIKNESLTTEDMPIIADYFLPRIERVSTQAELIVLLKELAGKWPVFSQALELLPSARRLGREPTRRRGSATPTHRRRNR